MKNLAQAIINVMNEVKGIDKTMTVGNGQNSYKGVPDQEVKKIIGQSMQKHGLSILPINIDAKTTVSEWEEQSQYGNKRKQSVFTEVTTKYLLLHTSGESQEVCGYGHGVDSQDKGAGKSTTYALKYLLLYLFMVPTGKIDDSDNTHSEELPVKPVAQPEKPWLNKGSEQFVKVVEALTKNGNFTIDMVEGKYKLSKEVKEELLKLMKK